MKKGFTLIELLVVVLIIGILASVALPQYQKAVLKSRIAQMLPFMASVKNAQEAYYLANGEYTDDWASLDVTIPDGLTPYACVSGGKDTQCVRFSFGARCSLLSSGGSVYCYDVNGKLPEIGANYDRLSNRKKYGTHVCIAEEGTLKERICQSMNGVLVQTSGRNNYYSIFN